MAQKIEEKKEIAREVKKSRYHALTVPGHSNSSQSTSNSSTSSRTTFWIDYEEVALPSLPPLPTSQLQICYREFFVPPPSADRLIRTSRLSHSTTSLDSVIQHECTTPSTPTAFVATSVSTSSATSSSTSSTTTFQPNAPTDTPKCTVQQPTPHPVPIRTVIYTTRVGLEACPLNKSKTKV